MKDNVSLTRRAARRQALLLLLLLLGGAIVLFVSGCGQTSESTPWPTRTSTPVKPTATPYQVAAAVSLPELPEQVDSANCVTCHTNQETLQAVAEEPEQVEALSEGEG